MAIFVKHAKDEELQTLGGKLDFVESKEHSSVAQNCDENNVGGQAVIEGIMMRHKEAYALAVRLSDKSIHVEHKKWYAFADKSLQKKPFLRGFPILVETLINGIKTLNRSAELSSLEDEKPVTSMQLYFTLFISIFFAIALFVLLPHALSAFMQYAEMSGDVQSFSFQAWDGLFKFLVFFVYLAAISTLPDIKRVFQFHGAEHKVIAAYENCPQGKDVDIALARLQSRFHPRCGTTFLLFVLSIAIIVHAILLPPLLWLFQYDSAFIRHAITICIKIILIIPISALAYELIKFASKLSSSWGTILKAPGLLLQRFTTKEPQDEHLEIALVALKVALGENAKHSIITTNYSLSE